MGQSGSKGDQTLQYLTSVRISPRFGQILGLSLCLLILADSAATKAAELGGFFPYTLYNQSEEPADDFKEDILLLFHGFKSTMPNHDYRVLYEAFKNSHTVVGFNYAYVDVETNIRELDDL